MIQFPYADLFCGAGGTSTGADEAITGLGFNPRLTAVNHWPIAVSTHESNHPTARHFCASLDSLNPRDLFLRGELKLLWASPECTHHSNARGGAPINDQSRATAWCVTRWAEALLPNSILVENVPEFRTWGPIGVDGRPLKSRRGEIFESWLNSLRSLGYTVDHKILCAADYGDPTTRKRLFIQAVRGRRQIIWPTPTHGDGRPLPWVAARSIVDWSLVGQSVFNRKRPLSPKTMNRIMIGLKKYGLKPMIMSAGGPDCPARSVDEPVGTILTRGHRALAEPFIVAWDNTNSGGDSSRSIDQPLSTLVTKARHGVAEPFLVKMRGECNGADVDQPAPTITAGGNHLGLAQPYLTQVEPHVLPQQSGGALRPVSEPLPTVSTRGAIALVEPYLIKFYGTGTAADLAEPLDTVTVKGRFGLAQPTIEIKGERYLLDIRFRMLQPHELSLAQGFPRGYKFTGNKTEQVKQIGNAVPRRLARALVAATVSQNADVSWLIAGEAA